MAKFSVYVPDALWDRVQREVGDLNVSHLVQKSLKELLASAEPSHLVERRPRADAARLERVRAKYLEEASTIFQEGHDFGMQLAEELTIDQLTRLQKRGFVLGAHRLNAKWEPWAHTLPGILPVIEAVARRQWGDAWQDKLAPDSILADGAVAALQEVWAFLVDDA